MATINTKQKSNLKTHEGAPAKIINAEQRLRRSVMACMLWENSFYEDGQSIAQRIKEAVTQVKPEIVANIAIEAREQFKLRHVPLLLVRTLAKLKYPVADVLEKVIQRPDEITEFLAIYWEEKRQPLSAQVKKGLAKAFNKFNEYQFAKYDRDGSVRLRDALFLSHAKPNDRNSLTPKDILTPKEVLFKKIVDQTLEIPDTWEVQLSAGKDKKEVWERLLKENKLGALALLRNLRNMESANVSKSLIKESVSKMKTERVLPFRFISAARYASQLEPELEVAMFKCLDGFGKMLGKTILLVDVSGSMGGPISAKSDLKRLDAACGLGMLLREICEEVEILTFSNQVIQVPPRRGFALRDAIVGSQQHSGTYLGQAIKTVDDNRTYDRMIVITDEQSHDKVSDSKGRGYMINVASNQNGVGYGKWLHVDGFSESIINYIQEYER